MRQFNFQVFNDNKSQIALFRIAQDFYMNSAVFNPVLNRQLISSRYVFRTTVLTVKNSFVCLFFFRTLIPIINLHIQAVTYLKCSSLHFSFRCKISQKFNFNHDFPEDFQKLLIDNLKFHLTTLRIVFSV